MRNQDLNRMSRTPQTRREAGVLAETLIIVTAIVPAHFLQMWGHKLLSLPASEPESNTSLLVILAIIFGHQSMRDARPSNFRHWATLILIVNAMLIAGALASIVASWTLALQGHDLRDLSFMLGLIAGVPMLLTVFFSLQAFRRIVAGPHSPWLPNGKAAAASTEESQ